MFLDTMMILLQISSVIALPRKPSENKKIVAWKGLRVEACVKVDMIYARFPLIQYTSKCSALIRSYYVTTNVLKINRRNFR